MTDDQNRFGAITIDDDEHATLRFVRHLPHSPELVWAALTDPHQISSWFMPGTIEPGVGGRLALESGEEGGTVGEVIHWEPPQLLAYTWVRNGGIGPASTVTWRLSGDGTGTRLVLEHADLLTSAVYDLGAGWHDFLDRLPRHLADGDLSNPDDQHERLLAHYRALA